MSEPVDIEELIKNDLNKLAEREGLKDAEFGDTELIRTGILPGTYEQQVSAYRALILKNLRLIGQEKNREVLYVKFNLVDGYPNSSSQDRIGELGRRWGKKVPDVGPEKGKSRSTEQRAARAQAFLTSLISKDIVWYNEHDAWIDLIGADRLGVDDSRSSSAADMVPPDSLIITPPARPIPESGTSATLDPVQTADPTLHPPRAEVGAILLSPAVLEALEAARRASEINNRQFTTIDVLLALLEIPGSKAAQAFDRVKPGQALEERDYLVTCQDRTARDGRHPYLPVNAEARDEVWLARERMWRAGNRNEVNELHVLLGILENARSGTRRDLERRLGVIGYASLRQAAESLLEAADTTPSNFDSPDDD